MHCSIYSKKIKTPYKNSFQELRLDPVFLGHKRCQPSDDLQMYQRTLNYTDMNSNVDISMTGLYVRKGALQTPRSPFFITLPFEACYPDRYRDMRAWWAILYEMDSALSWHPRDTGPYLCDTSETWALGCLP